MPDQSQIGETISPDSNVQSLRGGRLGDLVVSELEGRYYEMTRKGRSFSAQLAATTTAVAAGNITGAAAAASTQFALWNPAGSGVNLVLMKVFVGLISGTPVGGPMFHNFMSTAPALAGTAGLSNLIGGGGGSIGRYQASAAGAVLTGGSALTALRPMPFDFSAGAFAAVAGQASVMEEVNGDIVLAPGTGWVPCWQAAGTTLLNAYGVVWNEVPV